MSKFRVGLILTFGVSLGLGVAGGIIFQRLFKADVPLGFLVGGLAFGVVIAGWALLVAGLAPGFRSKP